MDHARHAVRLKLCPMVLRRVATFGSLGHLSSWLLTVTMDLLGGSWRSAYKKTKGTNCVGDGDGCACDGAVCIGGVRRKAAN